MLLIIMEIIFWVMVLTALLAFCVSLLQKTRILITLSILMFFSFGCDFVFTILYDYFNIYLRSALFYRFVELVLLLEFYYLLFCSQKSRKNYLLKTVIQFTLCLTIFIAFDKNMTPIQLINSTLFSICALIFFIQMIRKMDIEYPLRYPHFWINTAILIYFTGSLFIFLIFDPLASLNPEMGGFSYILHNIMGIAKNTLITVGFWKAYKFPNWQSNLHNHTISPSL